MQDLTPQLRTRLDRVELSAGVFVILALVLMISGFVYYAYHLAQRKGWFLAKATYFTYVQTGAGLKEGDPVKLMGFNAGEITRITGEDPSLPYNVYVEFAVKEPFYGYIWYPDSRVKVTAADFLGNRFLEVTKGGSSGSSNLKPTYRDEKHGRKTLITGVWNDKEGRYDDWTEESKPYYLLADESPAVTERLEKLADTIDGALPDILRLTNSLAGALDHASLTASNANRFILSLQPASAAVSNLAAITETLREPRGALGEWLLPTNLHQRLLAALSSLQDTLANTDTNLSITASNLNVSLANLAELTGTLNDQVQANTNILAQISQAITTADQFIQGLRRHWFLRSAFRDIDRPPRSRPSRER